MRRLLLSSVVVGSALVSACALKDVPSANDGGAADGAASGTLSFEGPLVLDDQAVIALDGNSLPEGTSPCRPPMLAKVYRALDGDTLIVDEAVENGRSGVRVRLLGVNSPEIAHEGNAAECFGDAAHAFTRQLETHYVYLTYASRCADQYDRDLAYVHIGSGDAGFFQRQLLRRGFAKTYFAQDNPTYSSLFSTEQQAGAVANAGLWSTCQ